MRLPTPIQITAAQEAQLAELFVDHACQTLAAGMYGARRPDPADFAAKAAALLGAPPAATTPSVALTDLFRTYVQENLAAGMYGARRPNASEFAARALTLLGIDAIAVEAALAVAV